MGESATVGAIAVALLALITWVLKRVVDSALENMKANTGAINESTKAIAEVGNSMRQHQTIHDERDRTMFRQLDRIESEVKEKES